MNKIWLLLFAAIVAVSVVSCGGDEAEPTPTTGTISGTLTLQAGVSGDLGNTLVALYASLDDWFYYLPVMTAAASGSGSSATYSMTNVTPGTYYLDAWKDVNNNQDWDTGDLYGWYGTGVLGGVTLNPFMVSAGQTTTINVSMIVWP